MVITGVVRSFTVTAAELPGAVAMVKAASDATGSKVTVHRTGFRYQNRRPLFIATLKFSSLPTPQTPCGLRKAKWGPCCDTSCKPVAR